MTANDQEDQIHVCIHNEIPAMVTWSQEGNKNPNTELRKEEVSDVTVAVPAVDMRENKLLSSYSLWSWHIAYLHSW